LFTKIKVSYDDKHGKRIDIEKTLFLFLLSFMSDINLVKVENIKEAKKEIKKIGSDPNSVDIMAPKMILRIIKLENVILQDAIIIKQDMLSIGGEVAVPRNTFELKDKKADILIVGNLRQLNILVDKLNRHYPRLKKISKKLSDFLNGVE
jgi:dihydropteroate synthase